MIAKPSDLRARVPMLPRCVALLIAASAGGCALFPRNIDPPESVFSGAALQAPTGQEAQKLQLMAALERDFVAAWLALNTATPTTEAGLADTMLRRGISLVDARCDRYFTALGRAAQKLGFAQKELGLTAGLVGVLQGLTGVAARDIAITAGGFGFTGASSAAYSDAFIFSPEVSGVQALVAAAQSAAKQRIEQIPAGQLSRGAAVNLLQDYEKTCEVHTIRRLVNESLSSAQPVASFSATEPDLTPLRLTTRDALAALLKVDQVSDGQLLALYWLTYKSAPANEAERKLLVSQLGRLPDLVDANGALRTDATAQEARQGVSRTLRGLVLVGASGLDAELAALKQVAATTTTAGASTGGPSPAPGSGTQPAPAAVKKMFSPSLTVRVPTAR